uniref:Ovule protein n=1 Tax=Ascaris lumbricoides TaxID=6252 RepID=A0A0M3HGN8_ASCLU
MLKCTPLFSSLSLRRCSSSRLMPNNSNKLHSDTEHRASSIVISINMIVNKYFHHYQIMKFQKIHIFFIELYKCMTVFFFFFLTIM